MTNNWWYEKDGVANGPIEEKLLVGLISTGKVQADTLVWKVGASDWVPANSVAELAIQPPPIPKKEMGVKIAAEPNDCLCLVVAASTTNVDISSDKVTNGMLWRRFFARSFDMLWISLIVSAIYIAHLWTSSSASSSQVKAMLFLLAAVLFVDAIIMCKFGTNIGKLILGVRVRGASGDKLSIDEAIERNARLYFSGMLLGAPVLSFFAHAYQFYRVKKNGFTSYDDGRFTVSASPLKISHSRIIVFSLIYVIVVVASAASISIMNDAMAVISVRNTASVDEKANHNKHYMEETGDTDSLIAVQEAIDKSPPLRYWIENDSVRAKYAISIDDELKGDPIWKFASLEERFREVVRRVKVKYGE